MDSLGNSGMQQAGTFSPPKVSMDDDLARLLEERAVAAGDAASRHLEGYRAACRTVVACRAAQDALDSPAGLNFAEKLLRDEQGIDGTPLVDPQEAPTEAYS